MPRVDLVDHLDLIIFVVLLLLALLFWRRDTAASKRAAIGLVIVSLLLAGVSWWRAEAARSELADAERRLQFNRRRLEPVPWLRFDPATLGITDYLGDDWRTSRALSDRLARRSAPRGGTATLRRPRPQERHRLVRVRLPDHRIDHVTVEEIVM